MTAATITTELSADQEATRNAYNSAFARWRSAGTGTRHLRELLAEAVSPCARSSSAIARTAARLRDRLPGQRGGDHASRSERVGV